jgi:hypothetical protein
MKRETEYTGLLAWMQDTFAARSVRQKMPSRYVQEVCVGCGRLIEAVGTRPRRSGGSACPCGATNPAWAAPPPLGAGSKSAIYRATRSEPRMDVAQFVITSLVALIGLYLAHSYRRQQRLRIAERRLDAYRDLWRLMEVARPTRIKHVNVDREGPLTREEARKLYQDMTHWYFGSGHGLLLPDPTKDLYLKVKERLGDYAVAGDAAFDEEGEQRIEEIGLLRAQMRLDLDIYSVPYLSSRDPESTKLEKELLNAAGINPEAWGIAPWRTRIAESIRQTVAHVAAKLPPRHHIRGR